MACLPMSWILGVVGVFVDGRKWLAVVMTVIATGLLMLLFAPFLFFVFCR